MSLLDWYNKLVAHVERRKEARSRAAAAAQSAQTFAAPPKPQIPTGRELPTRFIHLGLDYGTSWSKMVFRDYEAPGGEQSHIVFEDDGARVRGEFRFPSLVCASAGRLWFGSQAAARTAEASTVAWPSIKIRMALPNSHYGRSVPLPDGLAADDLAALTVAYLLLHARRQVTAYCDAHRCTPRMSFTLGVPMSDLDNPQLRAQFVETARIAAAVERASSTPDLRGGIRLEDAKTLLADARASVTSSPAPEPRKWVRSEVEAALLWAFKSPETTQGLYAAVDVGAGTTSASFFHIMQDYQDGTWVKSGMAFFGASCLPPGVDAIDAALAQTSSQTDPSLLRGHENELIARFGDQSIETVAKDIVETYRISFRRAYAKDMRQSSWEGIRLFLIGGGTEIDSIRERVGTRPWPNLRTAPEIMEIGYPHDLQLGSVKKGELKFLLVAYGLSHIDVDIPSASMPSQIAPLDLRPKRILDLDRDNPDEFRPRHT